MIRRSSLAALQLVASLLLVALPAAAQGVIEASAARPFSEASASAQRLRDSLSARLRAMAAAPTLILPVDAQHETALRDSLLAIARSQLGARYRLGAQSPGRAFDCSGLVRFVLSALRLDVPRTAATQALAGRAVEPDTAQLRPGDLLTFGRGQRVTHIGIYAGEGRFIHASSAGRSVVESVLSPGTWYARHWLGARRVVGSADPSP